MSAWDDLVRGVQPITDAVGSAGNAISNGFQYAVPDAPVPGQMIPTWNHNKPNAVPNSPLPPGLDPSDPVVQAILNPEQANAALQQPQSGTSPLEKYVNTVKSGGGEGNGVLAGLLKAQGNGSKTDLNDGSNQVFTGGLKPLLTNGTLGTAKLQLPEKEAEDTTKPTEETTKTSSKSPAGLFSGIKPLTMQDLILKGYEVGSMPNLQAAQNATSSNQLTNGLMRALSNFSGAITGASPKQIEEQNKNFNELDKTAGAPVEQLQQQIAMEKYDPASATSDAFRQFAKRLGVNIQGNFSAADAEKISPMLFKEYEAAQQRQNQQDMLREKLEEKRQDTDVRYAALKAAKEEAASTKADATQEKTAENLNREIPALMGSRGILKTAENTVQATQRLMGGLDQYKGDYNAIPISVVNEYVTGFANIAAGGQASDAKLKKILTDHNIPAEGSAVLNWLTGSPHGAGQAEFIKTYQEAMNGYKKVAKAQEQEVVAKYLAPYFVGKKIKPEDLKVQLNNYDLTPEQVQNYKPGMFVDKALGLDEAGKEKAIYLAILKDNPGVDEKVAAAKAKEIYASQKQQQ